MQTDIILYDTEEKHLNLLPLSYTRSIADFRIGILTIAQKWERYFPEADIKYFPIEYLREHYGDKCIMTEKMPHAIYINSAVVADNEIAELVGRLKDSETICAPTGELLAFKGDYRILAQSAGNATYTAENTDVIKYVYDVFLCNPRAIRNDYALLTEGRESQPLDKTNTVLGQYIMEDGREAIFIEEGATVEAAVLNVKNGPIYIGKDVQVQEGSCLRGPLALCNNAKVKMGAKLYSGSTFGPYCKVGGEIDNTVFFGYSNKAHDGYLGNAVIGEWCNIGAGTNASNLKNNYAKIRVWNYATKTFMRTDLQFCGLIMGDHSKIGVNCMLNTATVMGVGVNLHGAGFPRVFIPSFSEGSPSAGFKDVAMKTFHSVAERVMDRRDKAYTEAARDVFEQIYQKALEFK